MTQTPLNIELLCKKTPTGVKDQQHDLCLHWGTADRDSCSSPPTLAAALQTALATAANMLLLVQRCVFAATSGGKASAALCRHCCFATMRRVNRGGVRRRPASSSSDKDSNTSFASFYQPIKRPHSLLFPHFRLHSSCCGEKSEDTSSQCLSPCLALDFGELVGKK